MAPVKRKKLSGSNNDSGIESQSSLSTTPTRRSVSENRVLINGIRTHRANCTRDHGQRRPMPIESEASTSRASNVVDGTDYLNMNTMYEALTAIGDAAQHNPNNDDERFVSRAEVAKILRAIQCKCAHCLKKLILNYNLNRFS